jgi:hypothetical protein
VELGWELRQGEPTLPVSCDRYIDALWCNEEHSNAWIWLRNSGWRKLDDREADATTNLLAVAAAAKSRGRAVSVHEEYRSGDWRITEIADYRTGALGPTYEVSFSVSECIYGWTAAYDQRGTTITVRIRLVPDSGISAATMTTLRTRWKNGIESKWSNRFGCCTSPGCAGKCRLTFRVEWVDRDEHHRVRVRPGPAQTNMTTWDTSDSGDVASHEFGHMLGHPDEYPSSLCPTRSPVSTGTVMDDNTEVVRRLCQPFCDRLGQPIYTV